ncbi:MAG TPA: hypothetical protein VHK63_01520 [Candidatus Limnocylindria bacterium]|nr:hypothetical protein [Candidatus Limnocylindria bacterium]
MTRHTFDPRHEGWLPDDVDSISRELEAYASETSGETPHGLADRVMAAIADEPLPRRGILAMLLAPFGSGAPGMLRGAMVAGTMAAAVVAVVLVGQLASLLQEPHIGPSPFPTESDLPILTPTPSPLPSPSPSSTRRPTRSPTESPDASGTPEATDDEDKPDETEDQETPEPTDDNSGPGGGGDGDGDNSGPGGGSGGDGDSSGPGSGGSGSR